MQEYALQNDWRMFSRVAPPEKKSKRGLLRTLAAGAAAALVLSGIAIWRGGASMPPPDPQLPDPGMMITYRDKEIPVQENVPMNQYNRNMFIQGENGWVTYLGRGVDLQQGIDVSSHQKEIDWNKVARSGIDFAMIRVGYRGYGTGVAWEDEYFYRNIEGALDAGLDVGVYFFSQAINNEEVDEEIDLILNAIRRYNITYPVVLDWEYVSDKSSRTYDTTGDEVTQMLIHYSERMEQEGYQSAIYFNQDWGYLRFDLEELTDYPFWLAEYRTPPEFYYHFDMWQYTSSGSVPGIEGKVDMNLAFRDMSN